MIISYEPAFVFLEVPRAASRSIGIMLRSLSSDSTRRRSLEIPLDQHYPVIACVRNPYSQLYSLYQSQLRRPQAPLHSVIRSRRWSFARYLIWACSNSAELAHLRYPGNHAYLAPYSVEFLLRFEHLPGSVLQLPFLPPGTSLPYRNAAQSAFTARWREAYTPALADLVVSHFATDFRAYGYDVDSWRG